MVSLESVVTSPLNPLSSLFTACKPLDFWLERGK